MKKYFVTVDGNGFINHWTTVYHDGCIEVQAPEDLFTQIGYVKVIDGVAILDKEQLEKRAREYAEYTTIGCGAIATRKCRFVIDDSRARSNYGRCSKTRSCAYFSFSGRRCAVNWYEVIKNYYKAGYYSYENVLRFVQLKKITTEQADEIVSSKNEAG